MAVASAFEFVDALLRLHLVEPGQLDELKKRAAAVGDCQHFARQLVEAGLLTGYQADHLLQDRGEELLLGSYVLLEKIGEGGMGTVYRARNWKLGRPCAVKLIRKDRLADADAVRRFQREIRAAAQLNHANVVKAFDAGEVNGKHFFVMELVDGIDLARLVREHGPVPPALACEYIRQAALGLQHAHEHGQVHRDIKPENLLLARNDGAGTIKVLDMGLAHQQRADSGDVSSTLTQVGMVMGTPDYMAPEQAVSARTVDIRADLYSLGCTLYFLLTGTVPFPGGSMTDKLLKHKLNQPRPIEMLRPEVPSAVADIVYKLTSKAPVERPQTPGELAETLAALLQNPNVWQAVPRMRETAFQSARPAMPAQLNPYWAGIVAGATGQRMARRPTTGTKRWLAIAAAAALGIIAAAAFLMQTPSDNSPINNPEGQQRETAMSPLALVSRPPAIAGVQSWSIESSGHRGRIGIVVYSADSRRLASGGDDGTVRVWDAASGRLQRILMGHGKRISALAWSPDSKLLASGSDDAVVRLWDPDGGKVLHALAKHVGPIRALAWSPDGKTLASGSSTDGILLWSTRTGEARRRFDPQESISDLLWHSDTTILITSENADGANTVRLWDSSDGKLLQDRQVRSPMKWSAERKVLVHTNGDSSVTFWEPEADRARTLTLKEHSGPIRCLDLTSDGKVLATGGNKTVQFWDAASGRHLSTRPAQHLYTTSVKFSPDDKNLSSCSASGGSILLWKTDAEQNADAAKPAEMSFSWYWLDQAAWSPDGQTVFARSMRGTTWRFFDVAAQKIRYSLPADTEGGDTAWSPDGKFLAIMKFERPTRLCDADSGQVVGLSPQAYASETLSHLDWSPDGQTLAMQVSASGVAFWDTKSAVLGKTLDNEDGLHAVVWSPDGKKLATAGEKVRLWDVATAKATVLGTRPTHDLAWSPDSQVLASGGPAIKLWDAATGQALPTAFPGSERGAQALAWSPAGLILSSASSDGEILLWNAKTGAALKTLPGHDGPIHALAWLADSKTFVSLGEKDSTVCFWRIDADKPFRTATRLPGRARFSPDRKLLVSRHHLSGVQIWETETGRLRGTLLHVQGSSGQDAAVSADGHYRITADAAPQLVYVVRTAEGQETLAPEDFAKKYNWKNDPERVRLTYP